MSKKLLVMMWGMAGLAVSAREMATDRPDTTESPVSVPAGRFQIESELLAHSWNDSHSSSWTFGESLLKYGVTDRMDVQLNVPVYNRQREDGGGWADGFGNLTARVKYNLWGNDEGRTALGLLPYVSAPTSSNGLESDSWEFGLAIPFSVVLTDRLSLGHQQQFDWTDDGSGGRDFGWLMTLVFGYALTEKAALFAEGVTVLHLESNGPTDVALNMGGTYRFTPERQLDAGVRLGLEGGADDVQLFLGWSQRF